MVTLPCLMALQASLPIGMDKGVLPVLIQQQLSTAVMINCL